MHPNNGIIYAVIDTKADAIVGGLQLHRADAAAIRAFGDIASDPQTIIARHPEDFELRRLGFIDINNEIVTPSTESDTIITGAQWKAAQQPQENTDNA